MDIRTIGIDLGKTVFHRVGVDSSGKVVARKKCSRLQLLRFTSNIRECLGRRVLRKCGNADVRACKLHEVFDKWFRWHVGNAP